MQSNSITETTERNERQQDDETILEISGLTKVYPDGTLAVDDIDFSVARGDFCVIIGPSGCGKSTTLHSIVGTVDPTEGSIRLDGEDITDLPTYQRDISLVFQDFQLFPHLSVRGNIRYGLERTDVSGSQMANRVEQVADVLNLTPFLDGNPEELSAGQQQQVALARSLVLEPKLLLLDEPLGDLDYKLQKHMERELLRIHHEFDTTFVYVTHDQNQAMRLGDQLVVMNDGVVEHSGTTEDVYDRPANAFVSTFVGDSNTFSGEIVSLSDDESVATVETAFGTIESTTANLNSPPTELLGEEVTLSVRPHHVSLGQDDGNTLDCRVSDVIHHPASGTQIVADVHGEQGEKTVMVKLLDDIADPTGEITISWGRSDTVLLEEISNVPGTDLETDILGE
ncbi:ABC transporter ATP-binding protein [Haloarcula litorea]|uniref:ABC transporter ATP-binding protein n=1 Tax=Haloarcula litorea TaxID=3032579 RepID=UPI0023E8E70F|nr:ABC transporter ATP-binding protein [Halomicroarcula sp. GDY20]